MSLVGGVVGGVIGSLPGLDPLSESSVRLASPLPLELWFTYAVIFAPRPSAGLRLEVVEARLRPRFDGMYDTSVVDAIGEGRRLARLR